MRSMLENVPSIVAREMRWELLHTKISKDVPIPWVFHSDGEEVLIWKL